MRRVPLKYVVKINERALPDDTPPSFEFRYIDIGSVGRGELIEEPHPMTFSDAPSRARRLVRHGDTIISTVRTYLRAVWPVRGTANDLVVSTGFAVLSPGTRMDPRYLGWLSQSDTVVEEVISRSVGVSYPAINPADLGDVHVPLPPLGQQRVLADYLDAETARIDALIDKKRRLVELLKERRMTVISDGIGGAEVKLTLVSRLGSGHTPSREHPEWWQECTIPWITTGEVAQMRSDRLEFIQDTREMISAVGVANSSAEVHPAETVVLCRTASAGYSAIMASDMATSQDFATWTCGPLLRPRFLLLCLRAMRQDLLGRLTMGSTHQTIYMPDIESLRIPLPTPTEQDVIVEAVWLRLRRADRAVEMLNYQLGLLHERRQALITAAVTGELDIAA